MNFKGTKSEQNIQAAFAGESKARNQYTYFALQAKEEGSLAVATMFEKMADNEKEHAKIWFKFLNDGLGDLKTNLQTAAQGENYEWKTMYPTFAKEARDEGFEMLAVMFEKIAAIENDHERKFLETLIEVMKEEQQDEEGQASATADEELIAEPRLGVEAAVGSYRCMFCGNIEETRLDVCPVCQAIGAFEGI